MAKPFIIATRGSALALAQSRAVAAALEAAHPGLTVELKVISTKGDRVLDVSLHRVGDKGLFTAELEAALLDGSAEIAVHSLKDLPTELPDGLCIGAICAREDPRDVLVIPLGLADDLGLTDPDAAGASALELIPEGAVIGTSSLRRRALLLAHRPDAVIRDLRGNVDTRLAKLASGNYAAIVLAAAGLRRLGVLSDGAPDFSLPGSPVRLAASPLPVDSFVPAACQGAVAIESRLSDPECQKLLEPIHCAATAAACGVERKLLGLLGGGCQVPAGVHAVTAEGRTTIHAVVSSTDGARVLAASSTVAPALAETMAGRLADSLLERGAREIIEECRKQA